MIFSVKTTLRMFAKRHWWSCLRDWFRELCELGIVNCEITLEFLNNGWTIMSLIDVVWKRFLALNVAHVADRGGLSEGLGLAQEE